MSRLAFCFVGSWMCACVVLAASCNDDVVEFPGETQATTTSASGGNGGATPNGGAGNVPFTCEQCTPPTSICVDELKCDDTCPAGRQACHPSTTASDPSICCEAMQECCEASEHGYPDGDICNPLGEGCPKVCPDDTTVCKSNEFCALDAETMTYSCAADCNPLYTCASLCCPLGSTCQSGCVLPDLTVDAQKVTDSYYIDSVNFQQGSCSFFEGCIDAIGQRTLLRFDLRTPNIGDGDLFLGDPNGNDLFVYSPCHDHFHFEGYATYRLLDTSMVEVAAGHKQAFCLLDWEQVDVTANPSPKYDCGFQGIQKGWADTYESVLACQWVDVTDVPPGNYMLEIVLNINHTLGEKDYTNNSALVPVTIPMP